MSRKPIVPPIYHVTIHQIKKATQASSAAAFTIDGIPMAKVILVANVFDDRSTPKKRSFDLIDGTGRLSATAWNDRRIGIDLDEGFSSLEYVHVTGELRKYNDAIELDIFSIRRVDDFHEVFHHILQCMGDIIIKQNGVPPHDVWKAKEDKGKGRARETAMDQPESKPVAQPPADPVTPPPAPKHEQPSSPPPPPSVPPLPRWEALLEQDPDQMRQRQPPVTPKDPLRHLSTMQRNILLLIQEESEGSPSIYPSLDEPTNVPGISLDRIVSYLREKHNGSSRDDVLEELDDLEHRDYIGGYLVDVSGEESLYYALSPKSQKKIQRMRG